jgi:hypothetical protein
MGFKKPNPTDAFDYIRQMSGEISSPYNDGFNAMGLKQDLWQLKCFLDDAYEQLPKFVGEEEWYRQRTFDLLKRK